METEVQVGQSDVAKQSAAQPPSHPRPTWPLYVLFIATAGLVGAWISGVFLSESLAALGIPDPGFATTSGLPFFRSAALMLAALAAGSFLFSSFFVSPRMKEAQAHADDHGFEGMSAAAKQLRAASLGVDGSIAAKTGAVSSLCFALIAQLMVPMYLSDVSGEPLQNTLNPLRWPDAIQLVSTSLAWQVSAAIALTVGLAGLATHKWVMQPMLMLGAIGAVVPLGMEGHSATGGDHDYGTNSYLWHLIFMLLWVGGLMALIAHGRRLGPKLDVAVRRYSFIALVSVIVLAISGLINAAIRLHFSDWLTTGYGLLITAKAVGVVVLALFGFIHRQLTIPKIQANPNNHKLFRQVAAVEVLVMAAITGVAISLGRTPPPPPRNFDLNQMDIQLGYRLYEEPTFFNVWTMWRFDIMYGTIAILMAAGYAWGLWKLHKKGKTYPWHRTAWFMSGCLMLLITMSSGIGLNMPATFSMHMVGHMILTMGIPVCWVLGGPAQLFLDALDPGALGEPGPREWLEVAIDNPATRFLTSSSVNTIQFVVLFYILYITPLYELMISEHAGHLTMNIVFLWSGTLYYWELIGVDPKPVERSAPTKLMWLVFSMPFHLFFGVYLMLLRTVLGENFYLTLGLPWELNLLHDQNVGGAIGWGAGQFPLVVVFAALVWQWYTDDTRESRAYDKRAEKEGDIDMDTYNEHLAMLNAGKNPHDDYYGAEFKNQ